MSLRRELSGLKLAEKRIQSTIDLLQANTAVLLDPEQASRPEVVAIITCQNMNMMRDDGDADPYENKRDAAMSRAKQAGLPPQCLLYPYALSYHLETLMALMIPKPDTDEDDRYSFDNRPEDIQAIMDSLDGNGDLRLALKKLDQFTLSFFPPLMLKLLVEIRDSREDQSEDKKQN